MPSLPADAIVDIIFGVVNIMLTMAIVWQTRSIRKERCCTAPSMVTSYMVADKTCRF